MLKQENMYNPFNSVKLRQERNSFVPKVLERDIQLFNRCIVHSMIHCEQSSEAWDSEEMEK